VERAELVELVLHKLLLELAELELHLALLVLLCLEQVAEVEAPGLVKAQVDLAETVEAETVVLTTQALDLKMELQTLAVAVEELITHKVPLVVVVQEL
jgi:hypothetical protein